MRIITPDEEVCLMQLFGTSFNTNKYLSKFMSYNGFSIDITSVNTNFG